MVGVTRKTLSEVASERAAGHGVAGGWGAGVQACRLGKGVCEGHSPGSAGAVTQVHSLVPSAGAPNIAHFTDPLVEATIMVYSTITSQLLPTPAKSHYTFNLRDLSKVFQGMLMADPAKVEVRTGGPPPQCPVASAHTALMILPCFRPS